MPCLISAPTRSAIKETTRKKSKNKNFTAKTECQNLKAPSNKVKMQSDNPDYTNLLFLTIQQMESFHRNGLKMQKNSKNYKRFAKTEIIDTIKIISYYLNIMYF